MLLQTAKGFIRSASGASARGFTAAFMVNGSIYNFSGDVGSGVPTYSCNNARLTYEDKGDLTTRRFFWGTVGGDNITITTENGVTISGKLDMPIHPPTSVGGSGIWTAS